MRNLTAAHEAARRAGLRPAFVIVYADHPALLFAQHVKSAEWQTFLSFVRSDAMAFATIPYLELAALARESVADAGQDAATWSRLEGWVSDKIRDVAAAGD